MPPVQHLSRSGSPKSLSEAYRAEAAAALKDAAITNEVFWWGDVEPLWSLTRRFTRSTWETLAAWARSEP